MKNILLLLLTITLFTSCGGSKKATNTTKDFRATAPKAGPAPVISLEKPTTFQLDNGLTVIIVENHKLPTINMSLYFDYPSLVEGDKAGLTSFYGELMRAGTKKYTKEQLDEELDFYGIDLFTSSRSIGFDALKKQLPNALNFTTEVLFNPTFSNQDVLDKSKKQYITGLEADSKNPDAIMGRVGNALVYGTNHPWGEYATEETYNNVTLDDLKNHYQTYWKPNIAYLTFVGDIETAEAKQLAEQYFSDWKKGEIPQFDYPKPVNLASTQVDIVDLPTASQSNIYITNLEDLKKANPDYFAAKLGDHILGGSSFARLFLNLREDKGYTYGAYSQLSDDDKIPSRFNAYAKVRNEVTDSSLMAFFDELNKIVGEPVEAQMLKTAVSEQTGRFALGLERPSTIANYARTILMEGLDPDFYSNYLKSLNNQTPQTVLAAMKNYVKPKQARILIVGKAEDITDKVKALGYPVHFYDIWGKEVADPTIKADVGDVSINDIYEKYLNAIGGIDKLEAVKTLKMTYDTSIPGAPAAATAIGKFALPNKQSLTIEMQGMGPIISSNFDGKKGYNKLMNNKTDMTQSELDMLMYKRAIFEELSMENYKAVVDNIVTINDEKCYKVSIQYTNGSKTTKFYSVDTGLLYQEQMTVDSGDGPVTTTTTYEDYREFQGIKFPYQMTLDVMGESLPLSLKTIEINPTFSNQDFE